MKKRVIVCALVLGLGMAVAAIAGGLDDAKKEFKEAASTGDFAAAGRSFMTAAADDTKQAAEWIIKNGAKRGKFELYDGAKQALKSMKSDEAIEAMCKKSKSGSFEEKMLLAEVFRSMSDPKTAEALVRMVLDRTTEVVREAAISLRERGIREGVDNLITALGKCEDIRGRTYEEVRKALVSIVGSGADLMTEADWRNYWEIKKEEKQGEDSGGGANQGGGDDGVMEDGSPHTVSDNPKFFGQEVASKRILFILDGSGSMRVSASNPRQQATPGAPLPGDARINITKNELVKCVKGLKKSAKFDIIVYNNTVKVWSGKLVAAKDAAKNSAVKFVQEWDAQQVTHTDDAVKKGFTYKDADTIFLLSDGAPTHSGRCDDSQQLIADILSWVRDNNSTRKIKIFTFGFITPGLQGPDIMSEFMKKLAEENGGKFKALP
ncbi:MAG: VWA domain-containing protein [Planctomycetota bacterium]|jgi:hypothetical protein